MTTTTQPIVASTTNTAQALTAVRRSNPLRRHAGLWVTRLILWVIIAVFLFPVLYVVLYSFKAGAQSLFSPNLFPTEYGLENYQRLLRGSFPTWAMNSLIYGLSCAIITVFFSTLGGYAFSRLRFRGRRYGILALLIVQALPTNLAIVAFFWMLNYVGLYSTRTGLILILGFGGSALSVWLMRNFMESIPKDLDEASYLDGGTTFTTFYQIILPLVLPMLVAQFIFSFIGVYNEYILTSILIANDDLYPLGVGVRTFSTQFANQWTTFCAAAVLGSIPILIIFFVAQRFLVEGLTRGAIKG